MHEDDNIELAKLGDLIYVKGYDDEIFRVFSVSYLAEADAYESFKEIIYDVVSTRTGEFMMADHHDVTIFHSPDEPDYDLLERYSDKNNDAINDALFKALNSYEAEPDIPKYSISINDFEVVEDDDTVIDRLLDEINDWRELIEMFGEDKHYRTNIERLENELKDVTKGRD